MTTLLRQWPLVEAVLVPALMMLPPVDMLQALNLSVVDDALAVALGYLHCRMARQGGKGPDLTVFHPGLSRLRRPIEWTRADLRKTPATRWLDPSSTGFGRWMPGPELLQKVIVSSPPAAVDLLVWGRGDCRRSRPSDQRAEPGGDPGLTDPPSADPISADPISAVRPGGYVFCCEPPPAHVTSRPDLDPVGSSGRLFRRSVDARTCCLPGSSQPPVSLYQLQQRAVLVESYLGLARSLARRFGHRGERMDDLEQVALAALVGAAGRYDPDRGPSFGAYATSSILGELKRHFRDKLWSVRVPRSLQEMYLEVRAARDELAQASQRSPTIREIADHLGVSEEQVLAAMEAGSNCWALPLETPDDSDRECSHMAVMDVGFDRALDRDLLKESLADLDQGERLVIKKLYFEGRTQRQIADELGVSQMHISRMLQRTLEKLRLGMSPSLPRPA